MNRARLWNGQTKNDTSRQSDPQKPPHERRDRFTAGVSVGVEEIELRETEGQFARALEDIKAEESGGIRYRIKAVVSEGRRQ